MSSRGDEIFTDSLERIRATLCFCHRRLPIVFRMAASMRRRQFSSVSAWTGESCSRYGRRSQNLP